MERLIEPSLWIIAWALVVTLIALALDWVWPNE